MQNRKIESILALPEIVDNEEKKSNYSKNDEDYFLKYRVEIPSNSIKNEFETIETKKEYNVERDY